MKDFINELSRLLNLPPDLIEVDLILHTFLSELYQNNFFSNNFLLKGGTCLIKCYLEYYRFSEDLDFTFKHQEIFVDKSRMEIKKCRSQIIDNVGNLVQDICNRNGFDFINDKSNDRYYVFNSNYFIDLNIYYNSLILNVPKKLKIQLTLLECLKFQNSNKIIKNIVPIRRELEYLFPTEYQRYQNKINVSMYDIKEILCEKIRAILTRPAIKARDFVDVYNILESQNLNIKDFKIQIIDKIKFSLRNQRFMTNFQNNLDTIENGDLFDIESERRLLIKEINKKKLDLFREKFLKFLKEEIINILSES